jgi:hypothetical protein
MHVYLQIQMHFSHHMWMEQNWQENYEVLWSVLPKELISHLLELNCIFNKNAQF